MVEKAKTKKVKATSPKQHKEETLGFNKDLFLVAPDREVLSQYLRTFSFNRRQGTSSTKSRGEVSGSGIKPWRQKGTGRARVGDKRTPLWRHGGITHGPKPKSWNLAMNKTAKRLALLLAFSDKIKSNDVVIVETLSGLKGKTSQAIELLKKLGLTRKSLFVVDKITNELRTSLRNLKGTEIADVSRLNPYQVVGSTKIIVLKDAISKLEKKLKGKNI